MPQITNVVLDSFSSEDPNFPAKNLIETKVTKKWKCEKPGEKTAFVVFKLDKPYKITQIDIGNEFTGIIEIFVANSKQVPPNFQEIVLATSLMTVIEARSEKNPNRVRMFNKEIFNPAVADQKWDLVKVVCAQTFNNHKQFGLSFINLHTNEEVTSQEDNTDSPIKSTNIILKPTSSALKTPNTLKQTKTFGKFRFRDSNSDDEEEVSPFAQWKNKKDNPQSTSTAKLTPKHDTKSSIQEQLKAKLDTEQKEHNKRKRITDDDEKPKIKQDRNRAKGLFYDSSDDEPNEKLQKKMEKDKELKIKEQNSQKLSSKLTPIKSSPSTSKFSSFIRDDKTPTSSSKDSKRKEESLSLSQKKPSNKEIKYKPFNQLMEGVTFVISGYQNPERGILRQKALDMGAKYKADWDDTATHLICAYSNTPKYNQVKGKGKIVSKKWIENCFIEQKMIPWRRYALDNSEKNKPESDDEILCEWHKPKSVDDEEQDKNSSSSSINNNKKNAFLESEDSDGDMLVVDRRANKKDDAEIVIDDSDSESDMMIVKKTNSSSKIDTDANENKSKQPDDLSLNQQTAIEMGELENASSNINNKNVDDDDKNEDDNKEDLRQIDVYSDDSVSSIDITTVECHAFENKIFYLNEDLPATDVIKLKDNIKNMLGIVTKNPHKANYIITKQGKKLPSSSLKGEVVKEIWIRECFELQAFIPTTRYRIF